MDETHLSEIELVQLSQLDRSEVQEVDARQAEHLCRCAHCRSIMSDHRWLQDEVTATLAIVANALPVPRPNWGALRETLCTYQRRQETHWRVSTIASVVLAICLMLSASPVLRMAFTAQSAYALSPETGVAIAPVPVPSISVATPTPAVIGQVQAVTPLPTPVLKLPPTPPQLRPEI